MNKIVSSIFKMMRKAIFLLFTCCLTIKKSSAQFDFPGDSSDNIIQQYFIDYIDTTYGFQKQNDFEFRFWIFSHLEGTKLISLSNNNGKWEAKYFYVGRGNNKGRFIEHVTVLQNGLDSLWNKLLEKEILTMPLEWTLRDKYGSFTLAESRTNDVSYTFEFFTKTKHRSYGYTCPKKLSQKYSYIKEYREVADIVEMVLKHFAMTDNLICIRSEKSFKR